MTAVKTNEQELDKDCTVGSAASEKQDGKHAENKIRLVALVFGAILGLSAPGNDQWYLAWFLFAPIVVLSITAKEPWYAGLRGFYFFTGYNLVSMHWCLSIRPELLEGILSLVPNFALASFWLLFSAQKGMFGAIFCCWIKAIPMTGGWFPVKHRGRWLTPGFLVIPLLWIMIEYLCNIPEFLGVPWTSLEYSQYKQLPVIQIASITGGAGITYCLILANLILLGVIGFRSNKLQSLSYPSFGALVKNTALASLILVLVVYYGSTRLDFEREHLVKKNTLTVSAIQANLFPDIHKVDSGVVYRKYLQLTKQCPEGSVVIWPEWSFPVTFSKAYSHLGPFAKPAMNQIQSWVMGCTDIDSKGRKFNSTIVIDREKGIIPMVYHKRILVPFGEYDPEWVKNTPISWILYGFNKKYNDTSPGDASVCFPLTDIVLSPMLCFECLMPKMSAESVRAGAELLVDNSYTGWFYNSVLSDQMVAFCVMRACENHRSFVFSTTLGPSTIIDSTGKILSQAPREKAAAITADVPIETDITPFSKFCF